MCQEDKLTKGFSLFAPIGSCVSCAGHEETYFSHNFFSFLDKNSIHSTFIVRCLRGKMGGDFQGVPPLCVYFSLCGGCIASAFVRSSGSRLSGIFWIFFFRSANEEYSSAPWWFVHEFTALWNLLYRSRSLTVRRIRRPRNNVRRYTTRNSLIHFRFFFRVLGAGWKKKMRWNLNCLKIFIGGMMWGCCQDCWCVRWVRVFKRGGGSASPPFIDGRLRERTTPFVKYLFIFRNGTDASWKLPAVALWWLSFSPSSLFQWGTQKRNFCFISFWLWSFLIIIVSLFIRRPFFFFLVGVCTIPPYQQVESESLGRKLNVSNGRLTGIALSVVGRSSPKLCWNQMAAE